MTPPPPPPASSFAHALAFLGAHPLPLGLALLLLALLVTLTARRRREARKEAAAAAARTVRPAAPRRVAPAPVAARPPLPLPLPPAPRLVSPLRPVPPAPALAVKAGAIVPPEKPRPGPPPENRKVSILVVDDSAVARAKLRKLFEGDGYHVELARDGVEALEKLSGARFSVLITDLEMPNMNGLELIAALQGNPETDDLPVLAITGHAELQAGAHDYQNLHGIFRKPWNDRDLLASVAALAPVRRPSGPGSRPPAMQPGPIGRQLGA